MKIKEPEKCSTSEPSNFSAVSAASDSDSSQSGDSSSAKQSKFPQAPEQCTPSTLEIHQSGMTCTPSMLTQENSTASLEEAPVKTSADAAENGELKESDRDCGGKCSESPTSADPLSLAGRTLRERCLADVEKWLPASEWSDMQSRARSSYRHRNSERRIKESASSLLDTPTTYPQSLKGQAEAGRNKLESSLRLPAAIPTPRTNDAVQGYNSGKSGGMNLTGYLRLATPASRDFKGISATKNQGASAALPDNLRPFILPTESANPQVWGWMMGFQTNWCESVLMPPGSWESNIRDGGAENLHPSKQVCRPSESKGGATASTTTEPPAYPLKPSPSPSELSICGNSFKTSGLNISFGKTLPYLPHKTVTRRSWKDSHAQKFINAFQQNKLIKALDKDIRYGGKQIGWCRLLCAPYKEQLAAMPQEDLEAEGGMCSSVAEFIKQYFKGNSSLEVWVIRFEFVPLDRAASTNTLECLGVYSESTIEGNSNSVITLSDQSIHQDYLSAVSLCDVSAITTNSNFSITSAQNSIHQALLTPLGVYSAIQNQVNSSFSITLQSESIHQTSLAPHPSDKNSSVSFPTPITTDSIEAASVSASPEHQRVSGVYHSGNNSTNANTAISSLADSIHQSSLPSLGVYPRDGNQSDSNATNDSLTASIHQAPVIQGGSGLVYSFWKGESMVNHYRYKVKVNGKWKVRSIYIPVGKLPKVREAIANKLSVAAIVVEVLGRKL